MKLVNRTHFPNKWKLYFNYGQIYVYKNEDVANLIKIKTVKKCYHIQGFKGEITVNNIYLNLLKLGKLKEVLNDIEIYWFNLGETTGKEIVRMEIKKALSIYS